VIGIVLVIPGTIRLVFGYWRSRDATRRELVPVNAAGSVPFVCPGCGRSTFNLKQVVLTDLTFLVLVASFRHARYTGCPGCVRAAIEEYLLRNLLSANVLWIGPALRGAVGVIQSFRPGHSREIRRMAELQAIAIEKGLPA
jgi:hypothetical protein